MNYEIMSVKINEENVSVSNASVSTELVLDVTQSGFDYFDLENSEDVIFMMNEERLDAIYDDCREKLESFEVESIRSIDSDGDYVIKGIKVPSVAIRKNDYLFCYTKSFIEDYNRRMYKYVVLPNFYKNFGIFDWVTRILSVNVSVLSCKYKSPLYYPGSVASCYLRNAGALAQFRRILKMSLDSVDFVKIVEINKNHTAYGASLVRKMKSNKKFNKKKRNNVKKSRCGRCFNGDNFDPDGDYALMKGFDSAVYYKEVIRIDRNKKSNARKKNKNKIKKAIKLNNGFDPEFFDSDGKVRLQGYVRDYGQKPWLDFIISAVSYLGLMQGADTWKKFFAINWLYWQAVFPNACIHEAKDGIINILASMRDYAETFTPQPQERPGDFRSDYTPAMAAGFIEDYEEGMLMPGEPEHVLFLQCAALIEKIKTEYVQDRDVTKFLDGVVSLARYYGQVVPLCYISVDRFKSVCREPDFITYAESHFAVLSDVFCMLLGINIHGHTGVDWQTTSVKSVIFLAAHRREIKLRLGATFMKEQALGLFTNSVTLQGHESFKENTYDLIVKGLFKQDSRAFQKSDFGAITRRILTSLSLAPFLRLFGIIGSRKEYDAWYESNLGLWDNDLAIGELMLLYIMEFIKTGLPFLKSKDVSMLYPALAWQQWMEDSDVMIQAIKYPRDLMGRLLRDRQGVINSIDHCCRMGRTFYNTLSKEMHPSAGVVVRQWQSLLEARKDLTVLLKTMDGVVPPFSVHVWGNPAVGKSMVVEMIIANICHKLKINPEGATYVRNTNDEFWSNYKNQRILVFDDLGRENPDYNPAKGMSDFLHVFGDMPLMTNQADLADKGRVLLTSDMVIATSNYENFNCHYSYSNIAAAIRRFLYYTEVTIREEFKEIGGVSLNPDLIKGVTDGRYYKFTVRQPVVKTDKDYSMEIIHYIVDGVSVRMFEVDALTYFSFLNDAFDKHREKSDNVAAAKKIHSRAGFCEKHNVIASICGCEIPNRDSNDFAMEAVTYGDTVRDVNSFDVTENDIWKKYNKTETILQEIDEGVAEIQIQRDVNIIRETGGSIRRDLTNRDIDRERRHRGRVNYQGRFWSFKSCMKNAVKDVINDEEITQLMTERVKNIISSRETVDSITSGVVRSVLRPPTLDVIKEESQDVIPDFRKFFDDLFEKYRNNFLKIAGVSAVMVTSVISGYFLVKTMINSSKVTNQSRVIADADLIRARDEYNLRLGFPEMRPEPFPSTRPDAHPIHADNYYKVRSSNWLPSLYEKLKRNTYEFTFVSDTEIFVDSVCVFISGKTALFPAHCFKNFERGIIKLKQYINNEWFITQHAFNSKNMTRCVGKDLLWITFPNVVPHVDLWKYLLPRDNVNKVMGKIEGFSNAREKNINLKGDICRHFSYAENDSFYDCIEYEPEGFNPFNGLCGAVFFGSDSKGVQGIYGIHIGQHNDTDNGVMLKVYLEDFEDYKENKVLPSGTSLPTITLNGGQVIAGVDVEDLSLRSILRHLPDVVPLGTNKLAGAEKYSPVMQRTIIADDIPDYGFTAPTGNAFVDSEGRYKDPYLHRMAMHSRAPLDIDPDLIEIACMDYAVDLERCGDWNEIAPFDITVVLNGKAGTTAKRINLNAAAGMGFHGLKSDYVAFINETDPEIVPTKELWVRYEEYLRRYNEGESCCFPHKGSPKLNEALSREKLDNAKERRFIVSDTVLFSMMKCLLGPMFILMRNCPHLVESCIGVNSGSVEWEHLVRILRNVDKSRQGTFKEDGKFIDRDFIWYDVMQVLIFHIIMLLRHMVRNNQHYRKIVEWFPGIRLSAYDILGYMAFDLNVFPCQVKRDIVFLFCSIASGWFGTAELNSVGESLVHRMVYFICFLTKKIQLPDTIKPEPLKFEGYFIRGNRNIYLDYYYLCPKFRHYVILINYGDDNVENIADEVDCFYDPETQFEMSGKLGFPITDAKKTGKLKFSTLEEVSFLKRGFKFDEDTGIWMCPLEEKSIHKMLSWYEPSLSKSREKHIADNMMDAQRQYFMYGRDKFYSRTLWLKELGIKYKLTKFLPKYEDWPTFDSLLEDYHKKTFHMGNL